MVAKKKPARGVVAPRTSARQRIDETAIERVVEVIREWPESPLSWSLLCHAIRGNWSRQAMSNHKAIVDAFRTRKTEIAAGSRRKPRDVASVVQQRQIDALGQEVAALKKRIAAYEERFMVMLRNAAVHGLSQGQLEAPIHPIDRSAI